MKAQISDSPAWKNLAAHVPELRQLHLRELMADGERCSEFRAEAGGIVLDYSRQQATRTTRDLLFELARAAEVPAKLAAMAAGAKINTTENRAVLHTALRAAPSSQIMVDGQDVVAQVHEVLDRIRTFSEEVRNGKRTGITGESLINVVSIGIGGSYLGPEFVAQALATEPSCVPACEGRQLRFLANVDPIDVDRALSGLDPARTLVVVVSKTFTTAETMLNARTVRAWLVKHLGKTAIARHMVAVSTNLAEVAAFGIDPANAFGFWDWVGGRYSVCSAVGMLPLSLQYSYARMEEFLAGARSIDEHLLSAPLEKNLPILLGLFGVWNSSFLGYPARALLPYCQALMRFAPHIQQVDMESNGKRVALDGSVLSFPAGEIDFGEPSHGQHSFYQLIHQGRVVPCDFIGFTESQQPISLPGEEVSNHDELMANFFAQPDALAFGKSAQECLAEGVPEALVPHKVFPGNRPSQVLLLERLSPFTCGQLLALYEHRTAVQGFIWGLNSFDQWGVELGKVLAKQVRAQLASSRRDPASPIGGFNVATTAMLQRYLAGSTTPARPQRVNAFLAASPGAGKGAAPRTAAGVTPVATGRRPASRARTTTARTPTRPATASTRPASKATPRPTSTKGVKGGKVAKLSKAAKFSKATKATKATKGTKRARGTTVITRRR